MTVRTTIFCFKLQLSVRMTSGLVCVNFIFTYEAWRSTQCAQTNTRKYTREHACVIYRLAQNSLCHYYVLTMGDFIYMPCGVVHCYTARGLLIQIRNHVWRRTLNK